jgi:hypothetical protein
MSRIGRRFWVALAGAALCMSVLAGVGGAEEAQLTRKDYVSDLEKVCRPGAEATRRAMDGVRDDVHANRLKVAARKFGKAAKIFGRTIRTIAAKPRPGGDTARLRKWFKYLKRQEAYLKQISAQLRAGREIRAQRLTARFIHNGNLANNTTLAFGFDYCSFKFSRYG